MRLLTSFLLMLCAGASAAAQTRYPAPADMQTVHIALLKTGPDQTPRSKADEDALQAAHIAHLESLGKAGKAIIAGPLVKAGDIRGIVLLRAADAKAAEALEADDPAVKAGRLRIEIVSFITPGNWFSFGPLPEKIDMRTYVFGFLNVAVDDKTPAADRPKIQDDHLANLWALRESGALVLAGPVTNSQTHAGVLVMTSDSVDHAKAILANDPTVKAGMTTIELYSWFAADRILKGK